MESKRSSIPDDRSLYQIEQDALAIEQLLLETGGEISPVLEAFYDEVGSQLEHKSDAYWAVKERLDGFAERMRKRSQEYSAAARTIENASERLVNRIKETMLVLGKTEILGNDRKFKLSNGAPKLVLDEDKIKRLAPDFVLVQTTYSVDKERVKAALKNGLEIPGASFEQVLQLRTYVNKGEK